MLDAKNTLIHHNGMSYHSCNLYITMTQLVHIYNLNIDQHNVYILLCHQQMPLTILYIFIRTRCQSFQRYISNT